MIRLASGAVAATAVAVLGLVPAVAASAAGPGVLAYSSNSQSAGDPDTTVTFTVTTGALSMTAPVSADLGSGAPGTTIAGATGVITVTDDRALLSASWTTVASASDWTTRPHRHRGHRQRHRHLDRTSKQQLPHHRLHRHALPERGRPDTGQL